ncbi:MAG TPA: HNH endonuclease signature motif containing protein [Solirubrobacterales bacterium]
MADIGEQSLRGIAEELAGFADRMAAGEASRNELDEIIGELRATAVREFGPRTRSAHGDGAKNKILVYLLERLGEWVHGEELAAVSLIQEWPRRARELRVEDGYDLDEEKGYYRLNSPERDRDAADAWRIPNKIRKQTGSGADRILALFKAYEGKIIDQKQIGYVGKISSATRRVRELRDEKGWPIESHIDARDLSPGQYRLASSDAGDRRDKRQRLYPEDLRERIFKRDRFTCQKCGRTKGQADKEGDRRFYLEVHHKVAIAAELDELPREQLNDESNLVTYCHRDHVEETARLQRERRESRGS